MAKVEEFKRGKPPLFEDLCGLTPGGGLGDSLFVHLFVVWLNVEELDEKIAAAKEQGLDYLSS